MPMTIARRSWGHHFWRGPRKHADKLVSVVLPNIEFEAWFIAAAGSLGGKCGLR